MFEQQPTAQATVSSIYENEHPVKEAMQAVNDAAASRTTISRQSSSTFMHTRNHSRASSQSTRTSISEDDSIIAIVLKADKGTVRKVVEDVVEKDIDVMVAEVEKLDLRDAGVERRTEEGGNGEILDDKCVFRPVQPTLVSTRTNSYFDVKEAGSTPRRWRRNMDRNAMANPGASMYTRNYA